MLMKKARGLPLLIDGDLGVVALERTNLGKGYLSEDWLQQLIHGRPEILPIAQIEPGFGDIVSVAREVPCGHGSIDNLFVTGEGGIVLVEAKLWSNPQARREVVGQALDYVAALSAMNYEQFEQAIIRSQAGPKSLYGCVAEVGDALPEAEFVDAVSRNLARGRMIVLVVGDGIRREAEALADVLQSHAGAHFTFALVELATWREPATERLLVIPDVLTRTVMIERGVVRLEGAGVEILALKPDTNRTKPETLTQEIYVEHLESQKAGLANDVRAFLDLVDPLGVYPDFRASLNLKADIAGFSKAINFGYVTRTGKLWTDTFSTQAGEDVAVQYNRRLAELIEGQVARFPNGHTYLSSDGKSAPHIAALLPAHADAWAGAMAEALVALRLRAASSGDD